VIILYITVILFLLKPLKRNTKPLIYLFVESRPIATLGGILLPTFKQQVEEYLLKYINIPAKWLISFYTSFSFYHLCEKLKILA